MIWFWFKKYVIKKTVRGELCLPMMVFRHPQA